MKGSFIQQIKRRAMKEAGLTATERLREAVRTGKPMSDVAFKMEGKKLVAVAKP